jgi:hypothetical protein
MSFIKINRAKDTPDLLRTVSALNKTVELARLENAFGEAQANSIVAKRFAPFKEELEKQTKKADEANQLTVGLSDAVKDLPKRIASEVKPELLPIIQEGQKANQTLGSIEVQGDILLERGQQGANITKKSEFDLVLKNVPGYRASQPSDNPGSPYMAFLSINGSGSLNGTPYQIVGDTFKFTQGNSYKLTKGLADLIYETHPVEYSDNDVQKYYDILSEAGSPTNTQGQGNIPRKIKYIQASHPTVGFGVRKEGFKSAPKSSQSKVDSSGNFGKYTIDRTQLGKGMLVVKNKGGEIEMKTPVTKGLEYLLTHSALKAQAGKKFSKDDLSKYHELVKFAGVKMEPKNVKNALMKEGSVHFYNSEEDLFNRLEVLLGEKEAGNNAFAVRNEAMEIADLLLKNHLITKMEHKKFFDILSHK